MSTDGLRGPVSWWRAWAPNLDDEVRWITDTSDNTETFEEYIERVRKEKIPPDWYGRWYVR